MTGPDPLTVESDPARWFARAFAGASVVLALIAVAGAYGVVARTSAPAASAPKHVATSVALDGFFGAEAGRNDLGGRWLGDAGGVTIRGRGDYWLGFRASSLRAARTLRLTSPNGEVERARITPRARIVVFGPYAVRRRVRFAIRTRPGARVASKTDPRRVSVFLSEPRLQRDPLAVFPFAGFQSTERTSAGEQFNWMKSRGVLRIRAAKSTQRVARLTFRVNSRGVARTLVLRAGRLRRSVRAPRIQDGAAQVTFGPVRLRSGNATVRLSATPGARRFGSDPRSIGVRIANLRARTSQ